MRVTRILIVIVSHLSGALPQVEALRGELTALRKEGGRKLEDLEARLQDHIEGSKRLEQLRTADSDRHKDEVGSLLEWRRKHSPASVSSSSRSAWKYLLVLI